MKANHSQVFENWRVKSVFYITSVALDEHVLELSAHFIPSRLELIIQLWLKLIEIL